MGGEHHQFTVYSYDSKTGNYSYTTLADPFAGIGGTVALELNDLGQVVGYYVDSDTTLHGFIYSKGVYSTIDAPANFDSPAPTATVPYSARAVLLVPSVSWTNAPSCPRRAQLNQR